MKALYNCYFHSLHEIVTVKEEFMEQDDEEEEVIPSDFVRIKNEEEELNMCCTGCGEFFSGSAENTVCSGCLENDKVNTLFVKIHI